MRARFLILLLGASLCGCAAVQDYNYCLAQKRNADLAWKENYGRIGHHCSKDYECGWKKGYFALSTGECDAPPPTPPHHYWSARFQCVDGANAIADWYSGWQDGATAAVQDGTPHWHQLPSSPIASPQHGEHSAGGGNFFGGHSSEEMPPIPKSLPMTHEPHADVHVGPAPQQFTNPLPDLDDGAESTSELPSAESEAGLDNYYAAPPVEAGSGAEAN